MTGESAEPADGSAPLVLDAADFRVEEMLAPSCHGYQIHLAHAQTRDLTFFDTFEWGVWFRQAVLYECEGTFHLARREADWIGHEICTEETGGIVPGFYREFQNPDMRRELGGVLGLRRLVPVAVVRSVQRLAEVVNVSGKIVCRFELATLSPRDRIRSPFYRLCRILPLRGYDGDCAQVREALAAHGCVPVTEGPLAVFLRSVNNSPRAYTLRPAFGLTADLPAREAVTRIVRGILALAAENEPGIVRDQDTEFLHDYRICLRKIRSVLSLIDGVYPDVAADRMKKLLAALGRATNRLRDLDVCLLARDEYEALLPAVLRPALVKMFEDFEVERSEELAKVCLHLRSSSGRRRMRELTAFFESAGDLPPTEASGEPVGPLVFKRIYKRHRKIRDVDGGLGADTPDEAVHELRIQTKKLRYLLEVFGELVPEGQSAPMEKGLRRLQNKLGSFNDLSVQQKFLLDYWRRKQAGQGASGDLAMSLGGLIAILNLRQQKEREEIQNALGGFCSPEISAQFKKTFRPAREEASASDPAPAP